MTAVVKRYQGLLLACILFLVSDAWWLMVCFLSLPMAVSLLRNLRADAPVSRPADYPDDIWPLWYAASAFRYCSFFGLSMIVGLAIKLLL